MLVFKHFFRFLKVRRSIFPSMAKLDQLSTSKTPIFSALYKSGRKKLNHKENVLPLASVTAINTVLFSVA
jgi:hypothetical protein